MMKKNENEKNEKEKLNEIFNRGVSEILPSKDRLFKLMSKRKIRLYLGVDPTATHLHLGHSVPLRKLKQFQDLGHEVIFLIGTFTAMIGDPSARSESRISLKWKQVQKNIATYAQQVAKILDLKKTKIKFNSDWLAKISSQDFLKLASHFTVSQLLERDMFQERIKKKKEIWLHEFLYPLMQGYDSVAMNVDLEVGATDQLFNMLIGRKLQEIYHHKEKFILTVPLLIGLDGRKMSKTFQNTINLTDKPLEMYSKIMTLKDELIPHYFELCTDQTMVKIKKITEDLKNNKINPRDLKMNLAWEITKIYHGEKAANKAQEEFKRIFQEKNIPSHPKIIKIKAGLIPLLDLLVKTKLASSKSEAKRLINQKAVRINNELKENWQENIVVKEKLIIQKGKKKFVKVEIEKF